MLEGAIQTVQSDDDEEEYDVDDVDDDQDEVPAACSIDDCRVRTIICDDDACIINDDSD